MTGSPVRWTRSPRIWTRSPAAVGAAAITEFGVDVSRLHWDLSAPRGADRSSGGERPPPPSCRSRAVKLRAV